MIPLGSRRPLSARNGEQALKMALKVIVFFKQLCPRYLSSLDVGRMGKMYILDVLYVSQIITGKLECVLQKGYETRAISAAHYGPSFMEKHR